MSKLPLTRNASTPTGRPPTSPPMRPTAATQGLRRAMAGMSPADCLQEVVKDSNLRGRGGAGFPTGMKWSFVPMENGSPGHKYLICNADEMEPGTFKDRYAAGERSAPADRGHDSLRLHHRRRRGLHLHARRVPRGRGTCCARPLPTAKARNYLGRDILGSGYKLDMYVHASAGRYICGEETALITRWRASAPIPRTKPPFPQVSGLWGRPTIVNNVETLCNIPHIIEHGPSGSQSLGRGDDAGTKLFGVSGRVNRPGCWELPMGTTIREIIEDKAGGMATATAARASCPAAAPRISWSRSTSTCPWTTSHRQGRQPHGHRHHDPAWTTRSARWRFDQPAATSSPRSPADSAPPAGTGCPGWSPGAGRHRGGPRAAPRISTLLEQHAELHRRASGNTFCLRWRPGAMEPLQSRSSISATTSSGISRAAPAPTGEAH